MDGLAPTVAVFFAAPKRVYHGLSGLEVYDPRRDARTFPGGMPVIAHPPCRYWSVKCRHQAKPEPGERELGIWCAQEVRPWGGILEHPALSLLWPAALSPPPGHRESDDSFTLIVWQAWRG